MKCVSARAYCSVNTHPAALRANCMHAAGFAINAAVAFERQLAQMFFPLLSMATIIRQNPYYTDFNATFESVAKELMEEVGERPALGCQFWLNT